MRTLIDLPPEDMRWLDRKAAETGRSRAAVVREAVSKYRAEMAKEGLEQYFGLWAKHGHVEDGVEYQRRMRAEWDREWDKDVE